MAPTVADTCRQHLAFMQWADHLLLEAIATHMPGRCSTLQHIYLGEAVWFSRISGNKDALITDFEAPPGIEALQIAWPAMHQQWNDWAAACSDWTALVPHRNLQGVWFHMPAWQIVLHLVNHGSYHRGQVSAMIRAAGIAPPATDLIAFYRLIG